MASLELVQASRPLVELVHDPTLTGGHPLPSLAEPRQTELGAARRGATREPLPRLPLRDGVGNEPLDDPVEEVVEILGRYRVAVEAEPSDVRLLREIEDVERPGRGDGGDRAEPLVRPRVTARRTPRRRRARRCSAGSGRPPDALRGRGRGNRPRRGSPPPTHAALGERLLAGREALRRGFPRGRKANVYDLDEVRGYPPRSAIAREVGDEQAGTGRETAARPGASPPDQSPNRGVRPAYEAKQRRQARRPRAGRGEHRLPPAVASHDSSEDC